MNIKGLTEGKDYTRTETELYERFQYLHTADGHLQEAVAFKERTPKGEEISVTLFTCYTPKAWKKPFGRHVACVVNCFEADGKGGARLGTLQELNPTIKLYETPKFKGYQFDLDWALEDTPENREILIEAVYKLAFRKEK